MRFQKILLLLLGMTLSTLSFSQLSVGLETGLSTSSHSDIARIGTGASVGYEILFQEKLSLTCAVGFMSFSGQMQDGFPTSNKIISLSGGAKYYFLKSGKKFYVTADLGLGFVTYAGTETDERFVFSPGFGYRVNRWDFTGRLNAISQASYSSLRIAYVFGK